MSGALSNTTKQLQGENSMVTDKFNQVLPGFEDLHAGLRQLVCECGCGEVFFQTRVGRAKKYLNAAHKARYYRENKARDKARDKARATLDFLEECIETMRQYGGNVHFEGHSQETSEAVRTLYYNAGYELDMLAKFLREHYSGVPFERTILPLLPGEEDIPF